MFRELLSCSIRQYEKMPQKLKLRSYSRLKYLSLGCTLIVALLQCLILLTSSSTGTKNYLSEFWIVWGNGWGSGYSSAQQFLLKAHILSSLLTLKNDYLNEISLNHWFPWNCTQEEEVFSAEGGNERLVLYWISEGLSLSKMPWFSWPSDPVVSCCICFARTPNHNKFTSSKQLLPVGRLQSSLPSGRKLLLALLSVRS